MTEKNKLFLSIIIPSKNEGINISRCLESVINATKNIDGVEIMVVDSSSTDNTVEQALRFPVNIIQLKPAWIHTSSASRYLGCRKTSGKYIFITDADMELIPDFLTKAIEVMEKNNFVAGVAGLGKEVYIEEGEVKEIRENLYNRNTTEVVDVDYIGGAALFKRQALEETGYFNPYLYSQEELQLCQKLKKKEWKVLSLPYPMTIHYTTSFSKSMTTFREQVSNNRFTGIGQVIRWSLNQGFFWSNLSTFKKIIFFLILTTSAIVIGFVSLTTKNLSGLFLEGIIIASLYLYLVIKKKDLKEAAFSTIKWLYIVFAVARGFLKKPGDPGNYPLTVKIIRKS